MAKKQIVYIFQTLYSGCGEMSTSVWTDTNKVYELLKERIGTEVAVFNDKFKRTGTRPSHLPSIVEWHKAVASKDLWDWEFEYDATCTRIKKRVLNQEH